MLLVGDKVRLSQGPRHNGHRPAADPLFIGAALSGGPHTIAVVLSGTLDDGAAGAAAVERRGGVVVIQDPAESAYDGMPRAAMAATRSAKVLRLAALATFIDQESRRVVPEQTVLPDPDLERQLSVFLEPAPRPASQPSPWSGVTCPECGGPLQQEDTSTPVRFECQAGHAWSPESLLAAHAAGTERALWAAVLRLEERSRLHQVLAETAEDQGYPISAGGFRASARSARSAARKIRKLLEPSGEVGAPGATEDDIDD
jgi:two-component system, chemotaxis family, protein-glutamate methylesterase/glutaminase